MYQKPPKDFEQKLLNYQRYITNLRKRGYFLMRQIANDDETAIYLDKPFKDRLRQQYLTWITDLPVNYQKVEKSNAQLLQKSRGGCRLHGKPSRTAISSDLSRNVS